MAVMTMIIKRWLNTAPFLSRLLLDIPSINSMKINHFNTSYFAPFTTVNLLNFVNKNIFYTSSTFFWLITWPIYRLLKTYLWQVKTKYFSMWQLTTGVKKPTIQLLNPLDNGLGLLLLIINEARRGYAQPVL